MQGVHQGSAPDQHGQVDQPVGVAPLVVVPAERLDQRSSSLIGMTMVSPASKVHEAGEPTMSLETIGSSV